MSLARARILLVLQQVSQSGKPNFNVRPMSVLQHEKVQYSVDSSDEGGFERGQKKHAFLQMYNVDLRVHIRLYAEI